MLLFASAAAGDSVDLGNGSELGISFIKSGGYTPALSMGTKAESEGRDRKALVSSMSQDVGSASRASNMLDGSAVCSVEGLSGGESDESGDEGYWQMMCRVEHREQLGRLRLHRALSATHLLQDLRRMLWGRG